MNEQNVDIFLTEEEKEYYIACLTNELVTLRAKAGIRQEELSKIIGVSRQTYGAFERKEKQMSWSTYLALLFYFEHNAKTRQLLKQTDVFPKEFVCRINNGEPEADAMGDLDGAFPIQEILDELDEQGLHSVRTLLMVEYARCKKIPGEDVVKSFNGWTFASNQHQRDETAIHDALKHIREKKE